VSRVTQFTIGVFSVDFAVGLVLTIGPGRLLLGLVPHPQRAVRHVIELAAGVILLVVAVALWRGRRSLARRELPMRSGGGGSVLIAGASIAAVELPTAVPYFAVIAGIVASGATLPQEIGLLVLYNVAFVLPLLVIIVVLLVAGEVMSRRTGRVTVMGNDSPRRDNHRTSSEPRRRSPRPALSDAGEARFDRR
jgi:cytochrome c biogenesis protein CcdA